MAKITKERGDGGLRNNHPSVLSESNMRRGKTPRVGNINQSVHLVGNHMADQHANCANLLILSNRVQLIPLAAFISPLAHWRKEGKKREKGVSYDFLLIPSSLSCFLSRFLDSGVQPWWWMRWTRGPQVAAVIVGGGWQRGRREKVEKLGGREEETGAGMGLI